MAPDPDFALHPLSPTDVDTLLDIEERAFATNPISRAATANLTTANLTTAETRAIAHAWKRVRMSNVLEGRGDSSSVDRHWRKIVYHPPSADAQVVAVAGWTAPALDATKPTLEPRDAVPPFEDAPEENRRARELFKRLHDTLVGQRSAALVGSDCETHYWYLDTLATVPEFQQRGLGSMLVRWGIEQARADARARPGRVKGVWTIATPMGLRTYLRAGMEEIWNEVFDYGEGGGERGQKYVWLRMKFEE
ncbi:hypothetical protein MMC27_000273 [Xylographa pallens]|nr:hypothetical protein [Xylographa pallens]